MTVSLKANVSLKAVSYLETPPPEETFKVSLTRVSDDSRFRKRLCGAGTASWDYILYVMVPPLMLSPQLRGGRNCGAHNNALWGVGWLGEG